MRDTLDEIVKLTTRQLPTDSASIVLWDRERSAFDVCASTVPRQRGSHVIERIRKTGGATRWIIENREPLFVSDLREDPFGANPILAEYGYEAYAGVPLEHGGQVLGVLFALDRRIRRHTQAERSLLASVARWAALVVVEARTHGELIEVNRLLGAKHTEALRLLENLQATDEEIESFSEREARLLELQHRQRIESLGRMAGGIAHDFNNILLSVIGYADLAKSEVAEGSTTADHLNQVLRAADRATALVSGILSFSRKRAQEYEPFDLRQSVSDAAAFLRASLPASTALDLDLGDSAIVVLGDSNQLYQVVVNLGVNASQAIEPGNGSVRIELRGSRTGPEDRARLTIRDDGRGIAEDVRERIFEPYFTTKGVGGSGLGLAIVDGVISAHGGTIEWTSDLGMGSSFTVLLPEHDGPAAGATSGERRSAPRGEETIVVVDDEPALARLTARRLEALGYHVVMETSSEDALARLTRDPDGFQLLLSDLSLEGTSGLELVRKARESGFRGSVILTTGRPDLVAEASKVELEITSVLAKPHTADELAKRVRAALDAAVR